MRVCYVYAADVDDDPLTRQHLARSARYTGLDGRPCDEPAYLADRLELDDMVNGGGR